MADRRMLHRKVVESDAFYGLSEGAQCIYTHLYMYTDDDGFVNNVGNVINRFKMGEARLAELVSKRFLLKFGDVYVIKHWRIGNSLKNDRTKPPTYPSIAAKIWIKDNRSYTDHPVGRCITLLETKTGVKPESWNPDGIQLESERNPDGIQLESQQNRIRTELNRRELNRSPEGDFDILFHSYPEARRGNREEAFEAYRMEIVSPEEADEAMEHLEVWKRSEQWAKDGGQFVPNLSNWIGRGVWKTVPPKKEAKGTIYGATGELGKAELEAIRRVLEEE